MNSIRRQSVRLLSGREWVFNPGFRSRYVSPLAVKKAISAGTLPFTGTEFILT
jgi:hypothetical protein